MLPSSDEPITADHGLPAGRARWDGPGGQARRLATELNRSTIYIAGPDGVWRERGYGSGVFVRWDGSGERDGPATGA